MEEGLSNREQGQVWMAAILAEMEADWPMRSSLDPYEIGDRVGLLGGDGGLDREQYAVWSGIIAWMVSEGIITEPEGRTTAGKVYGTQLTSKGFDLLQRPSPGASAKSTGAKFKELAGQASKEATKAGAKTLATDLAEVVGSFIGNAAKPFISG